MNKLELSNIKGAIFDLDGTLLDSMGIWAEIDAEFLKLRGISSMPEDYVAHVTPMGFVESAEYTIQRFGLKETLEEVLDEWHTMAVLAYQQKIPLKPHAAACLRALHQRGVKLALATASPRELYAPALKHNGVYSLFSAFVTVDEVARAKEHPDIYLKAAEKLGLSPSECVVFEDIYIGIQSAKKGGFYTIGVYDPFSAKEAPLIMDEADLYIQGFDALL